jgi:hypothetical protein
MPTAAMTEPTAPSLPITPPARRLIGLRLLLIVAALFGAYDAYLGVTILFGDTTGIGGLGLGGFLLKAHVASELPLALAALLLAVIGRVRYAVLALAPVVIMAWLNYVSKVVGHVPDFSRGDVVMETAAQIIAFPLMATCAIALAAYNRQLGIATALVSLPVIFNTAGIALFSIAVAIYGF